MSGFDDLTEEVESLVDAANESDSANVSMVQVRHESGISTKVKPTVAEDKPDNMVSVGLWSHPIDMEATPHGASAGSDDMVYKYTKEERKQYRNEIKDMVREAGFSILGDGGGE